MRAITLRNSSAPALVDDDCFETLASYAWRLMTHHGRSRSIRYAVTDIRVSPKKIVKLFMHRVVMNAQPGECYDHINRDGLDNRRSNLRLATNQQNQMNRGRKGGTSRFKGVSWDRQKSLWLAQMGRGRGSKIGRFHAEEDAARAYDRAAREKFGEFACTNF
jgi:hypothetical protein